MLSLGSWIFCGVSFMQLSRSLGVVRHRFIDHA